MKMNRFLFFLILSGSFFCTNLRAQISTWTLNKYIYPLDTINIEKGFMYSYNKQNNYIVLFSIEKIKNINERKLLKVLEKKNIAIYQDPIFFNTAIPTPNRLLSLEISGIKNDSILKSETKIKDITVYEVSGKFILGISSTKLINNSMTGSYKFKKEKIIFVLTAY